MAISGMPMKNSPSKATTTMIPANATARPAVVTAIRAASGGGCPAANCSRKREITNSA